jgi:hypothetical protein
MTNEQRFRLHEGADYPADGDLAWPFGYVAIERKPEAPAAPVSRLPPDRLSLIIATAVLLGAIAVIVWSFL